MRTVRQLLDLTGRRALVTGGAGHIGRAVCDALRECGATVTALDRDAKSCDLACDLSKEASTRAAVRKAAARMGGLDILVHCAAFVGDAKSSGWAVPFRKQTVAAWDKALRVNLTSAFTLVQEARPHLEKSGCGSVVLFSSIYGLVGPDFSLYKGTPMANPAGYGASKGGLIQLTRYLSTILAPKVRVNAISPGGVLRGQPASFRRRYQARTPLGRMAVEEDLKGAAAYLVSDASAYMTGQNLVVDGGWTAW